MLRACSAAWREARPAVVGVVAILVVALGLRSPWLAALALGLFGWLACFFRDPERTPGSPSPDALLAPADGRVTAIETVDEPRFMGGPARRVSIFLSLLDVHVQRSPCDGVVGWLEYRPGTFAPAYSAGAERNESNLIGLETAHGRMAVRQVAGVLARRIVCWPAIGDRLRRGQRLGLIKFGSRVDLFLPPHAEVLVRVGQRVRAGQTVVASLPLDSARL